MVYNAAEDTNELDDSFIRELFQSDSELGFEGFVVWKTPNLKRKCCEYKYLKVSKQAFEFTIGLKLQTIAVVIISIFGK